MKNFILLILLPLFLFSCDAKEKQAITSSKSTNIKQEVVELQEQKSSMLDSPYKLGLDYELIAKPYDTKNDQQVVVYEFFGYTCPHCYTFEPFINKWLKEKSEYVKFIRVPLNFQQGWGVLQQGYLTAELMGITESTHQKLFKAIHDKRKNFNSIDDLAQWYEDNSSIDKKTFLSTADSFLLDSKQRKADNMGFVMKIKGTPSVVVNGRYKVSKKIKDRNEIMKVAKYLTSLEAKRMGIL